MSEELLLKIGSAVLWTALVGLAVIGLLWLPIW